MPSLPYVTKWLLVPTVIIMLLITGCGSVPSGGSTATPASPGAAIQTTTTEPSATEQVTAAPVATEQVTVAPVATEQVTTSPISTGSTPPPFDTVSQPQLCPGSNADLTAVKDIVTAIDPRSDPALPGVSMATVPYTNRKGQKFEITARGRDAGHVQQFLLNLRLCLEAIDQVGAGPSTYLAGIETDGKDEPNDLPFKDGTPVVERLLGSSSQPTNILVEVEWLDAPELSTKAKDYAIYYVFDPTINNNEWHGYIAKCQKEAWARVRVSAGGATVYSYINGAFNHHASAWAVSTSAWRGGTALVNRTYDASVQGLQNGSSYAIDGGWTRGTGGGC